MGLPDNVLSPWRPDPFPYDILVYRTLPNGKLKVTGFRLASADQWNSRQANQRVARMQTGDRKTHDFSLLNVQVWDRLSDGGVGAKETADTTRYAWSENVFAGDVEGLKLSPITQLIESFVVAGEKIIDFFLWPGPKVTNRSAGASDGMLIAITSHASNGTKMYSLVPTSTGATVTLEATWSTIKTIHCCLHRNKLYLSQLPAAETDATTAIREVKWSAGWQINVVKGNYTGEIITSDGRWFYKTLGNLVYRTSDVYIPSDSGTITWQGPVWVGDGSPINNLVTYGSDEGRAVYVVTWKGLYRILEESGEIKHANPIDERSGTADDEHGLAFELANNEIIWNYPRGILRHSLGQTQGSSPWEDDGVPISQRGLFGDLQDGVGGIYISNNPIGTSKATIYRWQEQRWHTFLVYQDANVERIDKLYWTTRQVADTARLWAVQTYNGESRLAWLPMPTSTQNYRLLPNVNYPPEGTLTYPRFKSELADLIKNWASASIDLLDNGSVGTGVVEVLGTHRPGSDSPSYQSFGTYTCVPGNGNTLGETRWVPCKAGQHQHDRIPIDLQSREIQLQLKLKRGVGAAYPDTGLSNPDGKILDDGTIVLWGYVPPVSNRPYDDWRPLSDSALMQWQDNRWVHVDLDAYQITSVVEIDNDWCWVAGYLSIAGNYYGLVRWQRSTGVLIPESVFENTTVRFGFISDSLMLAFTEDVSGWKLWQTPEAGLDPWSNTYTFNGQVRYAAPLGSSVVVVGDFTEVTGPALKIFTDAGICRLDVQSGSLWGVSPAGIAPEVLRATKSIKRYASGLVYFAAGIDVPTGRLWSVTSEAALTNSCTFTPIALPIANGYPVSAIADDTGVGLMIGMANGSVYQQGSPWIEVIDSPHDNTSHPVRNLLLGGKFICCDYRGTVNSRGRHVNDTQQVLYEAAQLVFIPPPTSATEMPTPVVERTALWFVEFPVELMQYGLPLNPSSDTKLLDMQVDPRSASEIWEELHELCTSHQFVTAIMPDRKAYRGWFSTLVDAMASVSRGEYASPINEQHMTEVQFNQVEELHQPVTYRLPGVYDG